MRVAAIDPGETCGVAVFSVTDVISSIRTAAVKPGEVYDMLATEGLSAVAVEEFRLYPWLARSQGFSTLPTVECIGVIKYLCAQRGVRLDMQRADIKKEARTIGETVGFKMKTRSLGSGKGKYVGPDFDIPGAQHPRDALAHGVYWAFRNKFSPLYEKDCEA